MKLVKSDVASLFSVRVFLFRFEDYNKEVLVNTITNMKREIPSEHRSNLGGWQSPNIFDLDLSEEYKEIIVEFTKILFQGIKQVELLWNFQPNFAPEISSLWFNWNEKGNFNVQHSHLGTGYSGAFYIKKRNDPTDGVIEFEDARRDALMWEVPRTLQHTAAPLNGEQFYYHKLYPNEGDLLIFPSYLQHRVLENKSDDVRITSSFNFNWYNKND